MRNLMFIILVIGAVSACTEYNSSDVLNTNFTIAPGECVFFNDTNITLSSPTLAPMDYNFTGGEGNTLLIPDRNITIIGQNQSFNASNLTISDNGTTVVGRFNLTITVDVPKTTTIVQNITNCSFNMTNVSLTYNQTYVDNTRNITCIAPVFPKINQDETIACGSTYNNTTYGLVVRTASNSTVNCSLSMTNVTLDYGQNWTSDARNVTCIAPVYPTNYTCPVIKEEKAVGIGECYRTLANGNDIKVCSPEIGWLDLSMQAGESKDDNAHRVRASCAYSEKEIYTSSYDLKEDSLTNCGNVIELKSTGEKVCVDTLGDFCITDMVRSGNLAGCVEELDKAYIQVNGELSAQLNGTQESLRVCTSERENAQLRLADRDSSDRNIITYLMIAGALIAIIFTGYKVWEHNHIPTDNSTQTDLSIESPRAGGKLGGLDDLD